MSYILDALKKAEREHGRTKVPNIETVHEIAVKKKKIVNIAAECGAVCLIAAVWLYFGTSFGRVKSNTPAPTAIYQDSVTKNSEPPPETRKLIDPNYNSQPASPEIAMNQMIPKTFNAQSATMPEIQPRAAAAKPENADPGLKTESPVAVIATVASRESPNPPGNSPPLREIAGSMKMNISFHVYSDNPYRRMIFINGTRYREGDSLEQDCILEEITPEGLILRRGEETVFLRMDAGS